MRVISLEPESSASANSAIPAFIIRAVLRGISPIGNIPFGVNRFPDRPYNYNKVFVFVNTYFYKTRLFIRKAQPDAVFREQHSAR